LSARQEWRWCRRNVNKGKTLLAANSLAESIAGRELPLGLGTIPAGWGLLIAALVHGLVLFHVFALMPLFFIWLERKVSARIQDRLGPTRVGGRFGWLQSVADGVKLVQKEDLAPAAADRRIFLIAPLMAAVASFSAFLVIPFSEHWVAVTLDAGLFILLALMSLEVFGIILAGYSSGSKWALFGAMREAAQMVSYEIPMALCALIPVLTVGSLNLRDIVQVQQGGIWNWLIFRDLFTFCAFFVYFTVALASVKRAPFDLAEAESELVAGFHTEYSGLRWSFFFLAEYASMFAVSAIAVLLFLGGWNTGFGLELMLSPLRGAGQGVPFDGFSLGTYLLNGFHALVFVIKASLLVVVQMWVRWTLPRLRIDQVMTTCLKYLLPISAVLFVGAAVWPLMLTTLLGQPTLLRIARPVARVWESTARRGDVGTNPVSQPAVGTPATVLSAAHREDQP
jgi:NADH-quinone oxidoreductase subunit H